MTDKLEQIAVLLKAIEAKNSKFHNMTAAASNLTGAIAFAPVSDWIEELCGDFISSMFEFAMADGKLADVIQDQLLGKENDGQR